MIPVINVTLTGLRIKELMAKNGYSVKDIQIKLGLACPQGIYKWFDGKTLPSLDNLVILATIFNVKIDDILVIE